MLELKNKTILLVEDEAILALHQKKTLNHYGYEVLIASSGEEAMEMLASAISVDLVLMDINLGDGMDGTQAAEIILAKYFLPLIFLSSHTEPEIVEKTEGITSYGYIVKNSGETVMIASIKMAFRLFESRKLEREKDEALWIKNSAIINSINAIVFADLNGNVTYVNDAFLRLWKFSSAEEVLGRNAKYFWNSDTKVERIMDELASIGSWSGDGWTTDVEGNLFFVKISANMLKNKAGMPVGMMSAFVDITESKQAQEKLTKANKLLEQTFEQSPVPMILISAPDALIENVNPACLKFLGIEDEKSYIGTSFLEYKPTFLDYDLQGHLWKAEDLPLAKSLRGEKASNEARRIVCKDGTERWALASAAPIFDDNHNLIAGYLIMIDITEKRNAEIKENATNELIRLFIKHSPIYAFIKEVDEQQSRVITVSDNFVDMVGIKATDMLGKNMYELFPEELAKSMTADDWAVVSGKQVIRIEETFAGHFYNTVKFPLLISGKNLLAGYTIDVTTEKETKIRLSEELERNTNILNAIPVSLLICRYGGGNKFFLESFNTQARIATRVSSDMIGKLLDEIWPEPEMKENIRKFQTVIESGHTVEYEVLISSQGISEKAFRVRAFLIPGEKLGIALEDIAQIKIAEQTTKDQLVEKELLLKEAHHRIKNNFAAIESLLKIQYSSTGNSEVKKALEETSGRIASSRILYEKLTLSDDFRLVDQKGYLEELIETVRKTFIDSANIEVLSRIEEFQLDTKKTSALGIIVNELLTNAMKYAFGSGQKGLITIDLKIKDKKAELVIKDNGKGLSSGIEPGSSKSFGMLLIRLLTEQLRGELHMENDQGLKVSIRFPL